jgi:uncharacterized protein (TIGR02996 family)
MTHEAAFLVNVLAAPNDDAPRLIFADWLEEYGGQPERGEFIRVQIALAAIFAAHRCQRTGQGAMCIPGIVDVLMGCDACNRFIANRDALQCRERELWEGGMRDAILGPLCGNGISSVQLSCRRGFVDCISCTAAEFLQHADALLAAAPISEVWMPTWLELFQYNGRWMFAARKGRSPVVCPRRVNLRWPNVDERGPTLMEALQEEWPKITFKLPPEGPRVSRS